MPRTHKRKKIEQRLGRPLRTYLRDRFLGNPTQSEVAKQLGLDPATIRYYIKKWDLPYDPGAAREKKVKRDHLDLCICLICRHEFCQEARESHHLGRCVMRCRSFEGRLKLKSGTTRR